MSARPLRLSRRVRNVLLLQAAIAAVLMVSGTFIGSRLLSESLLRDRVQTEAVHLWDALDRDPQAPLPQGFGYEAYFVADGRQPDAVPPQLRVLAPGFHRLAGPSQMAYVGERAQGRLYLRVSRALPDKLVLWTAMLAGVLSLLGIGTITWMTSRRFHRLLRPMVELSRVAERWRPESDMPSALRELSTGSAPIDEVERLRKAMVDMTERMDAYIARERHFTRDASHELRTPLTVVRMASDLLSVEPNLSARGQRAVGRIDQVSREMEGLVEAFLVLARGPDVPVDYDEVDVAQVAADAVEVARQQLADRPVSIALDLRAQPLVEAPPRVLGVILGQLLENACAFTESGSITVVVQPDAVEIIDTGIGMEPDTLARVFDPFFRADISTHAAKGLGLNVVQRLAERIRWHVDLESRPGAGTTAILRFGGA